MADTYAVLGLYGLMPPAQAGKLCTEAADRALDLAPELPQAQFSHALCATVFPWFDERGDPIWPDDRMREIWERYPDFAEAGAWFGIARATRGGIPHSEVAALAARVRSIEPDSPYIANITGLMLSWSGAHADALTYLLEGLARAGRTDDAHAILDELLERQNDKYIPPIAIAAVAANVGETELALEYVDEAVAWDRHAPCSWWLRFPVWDRLYGEPDFADAFRRVGMVPPEDASPDARGTEDHRSERDSPTAS